MILVDPVRHKDPLMVKIRGPGSLQLDMNLDSNSVMLAVMMPPRRA